MKKPGVTLVLMPSSLAVALGAAAPGRRTTSSPSPTIPARR